MHLLQGSIRHHLSFVEHRHPRAEQADEFHVVLDDDDAVVVLQFQQQLRGENGFFVGQPGGRLVDQQQHRRGQDQHADFQPLPLAVAQVLYLSVGGLRQADAGENLENALALFGGRRMHEAAMERLPARQRQLHVFVNRQAVEDGGGLEFASHAAAGDFRIAHAGDIGIGESHRAGRRAGSCR